MTDQKDLSDYHFNIIKHRGDPTTAQTVSGHTVKKEPFVFFQGTEGKWNSVACAEYGDHFVYIDPLYSDDKLGKGHWFALCTCGSAAVIVGPAETIGQNEITKVQTLVCLEYTKLYKKFGVGKHLTSKGDVKKLLDQLPPVDYQPKS